MPKSVDQMTPEELEAMTPEEVAAAMRSATTPTEGADGKPNKKKSDHQVDEDDEEDVSDEEESDEEDEEESDDGSDEESDEEDSDDDDEGDESDDDNDEDDDVDIDALEALASEGKTPKSVPYAALRRKTEENAELRELLRAALGKGADAGQQQQEEAAPKRPEYDFKASRRELHKLIQQGETDKAAALEDEMEEARSAQAKFDLEQATSKARNEAVSHINGAILSRDIAKVERKLAREYPFLDTSNPKTYNEVAGMAVNALAKKLAAGGKNPVLALREAGDRVGKQFAKTLGTKGGKAKRAEVDGKDARSRQALRRNLSLQQPPVSGKKGVANVVELSEIDPAKIDYDNLTPKQERLLKEGKLLMPGKKGKS